MAKAPKAKWTVLVYLAGDNDLDGAGLVDLREMKEAGSGPHINIVAQFDRAGGRGETKRYFLRKGTTMPQDVVATLGETDMGDPAVLRGFLDWGAKTYPAEHTMVVIWNHGTGWDDTNIYRSVEATLGRGIRYKNVSVGRLSGRRTLPIAHVRALSRRPLRRALFASTIHSAVKTRAIAFDDDAQDFLDNIELKRVLTRAAAKFGGKIAVLGMDACLMSMVEVAYQIRTTARVMVGSQEVEPGQGWPYHMILKALASKPAMTPDDVGKLIVGRYLASYPASAGVTQSALDLAQATGLARAIDKLAVVLKQRVPDERALMALVRVRRSVQSYDTKDYVDLVHFCRLLRQRLEDDAIAKACAAVEAQGVAPLVIASGFKGRAMANSHGVSIYFPEDTISPLYAKLDFARAGKWQAFLKAYLAALRS